ncbi:hypothetical protein DFAR_1310017 [Desulfarculales bacterium]
MHLDGVAIDPLEELVPVELC